MALKRYEWTKFKHLTNLNADIRERPTDMYFFFLSATDLQMRNFFGGGSRAVKSLRDKLLDLKHLEKDCNVAPVSQYLCFCLY